MKTKFIFVTGGVLSSLGKGLTAACLASLLKARGLNVTQQKCDPYLNMDPGRLSPFQHGEVYVTEDGAETDLDLGHYERFLNVRLTSRNSTSAGKIYHNVFERERNGEYNGGTVQIIPNVTDEIKHFILQHAEDTPGHPAPDVVVVEIGGTVGDIEGLAFLEAIRQIRADIGRDRCLYVHLTLVPYVAAADEYKSKPTQHSVKELRAIGIQPDIIICRCAKQVPLGVKEKIALFCNVDPDAVFTAVDVPSLYQLPLKLYEEGLDQKVAIMLRLPAHNANLAPWQAVVDAYMHPEGSVSIAVVGKYVKEQEAYKSLHEALMHGGIANRVRVNIDYVDSTELTSDNVARRLGTVNGILVPDGFGDADVDGILCAIRYAREHKVPFFGLCLGMQLAVLEFARHVAGIPGADTEEFNPGAEDKVVFLLPDRSNVKRHRAAAADRGGIMRLGAYPCRIAKGTLAFKAYGKECEDERHRHRYEFNGEYRDALEKAGMVFSGVSPDGSLVEMVELADHPWFVGCQFIPEFHSSPLSPHPLYRDFIAAAGACQ